MHEHESIQLTDMSFPISVMERHKTMRGQFFHEHAHESSLQFFYFDCGEARLYCSGKLFYTKPGSILIVNNGELHYGENCSDKLDFYIIEIHLQLLEVLDSICFKKYVSPVLNNLILFQNQPESQTLQNYIRDILYHCGNKPDGYELKLISDLYALFYELFSSFIAKSYSSRDAEILGKKRARLQHALDYIEQNYTSRITLQQMADYVHMSPGYFCGLFKQTTGRSLMDYINRLRIEKALLLLNQGSANVTEAALSVGFDDINYFTRVFKKYMKQPPASFIKTNWPHFL